MSLPADFSIKLLGPDDANVLLDAEDLFDSAPIPDQTRAFLMSDRDFLWLATIGNMPVGFVSASVLLHPDKPPHLFVNELSVHEDHRRKRVATALIREAVSYAKAKGLEPVWVAAEADDDRALAFYRSLAVQTEYGAVVFEWSNLKQSHIV